MDDQKPSEKKTPLETPIQKKPHDTNPLKDPDLSPDNDNPINPKESPMETPDK